MEIHITHGCNMRCAGCTHYADYGIKSDWFVSIEKFEKDISMWAQRIEPWAFIILGGEPTLHPQLCEIIEIAARYFKYGRANDVTRGRAVGITTNGACFHKHPRLKEVLFDNNVAVTLSVHYRDAMQAADILRQWKSEGLQVNIWDYPQNKNLYWRKLYKGHGETMTPFDDDPRTSWEKCQCKDFFQIHEGKLWKCAPIAYFQFVDEEFNLVDKDSRWNLFSNYKPLEPDCDYWEMKRFLEREEEAVCACCPSEDLHSSNTKNDSGE